jgi:hypothetical protein
MTNIQLVLCFLLAVTTIIAQQSSNAPFVELDRQVKKQAGGWNGENAPLATVFNKERLRLGDRFESELLKYIRGDVDKHMWVSVCLDSPNCLLGNKPLSYLSLLIMQEGISLLSGKTDEESFGRIVTFDILAAVESQKLGLIDLASSYKRAAELKLAKDADLRAYFPALTEKESHLYDALPGGVKTIRSSIPQANDSDRPQTRVSAGVLNSRALKLPMPTYPAVNASGEVVVGIVYDESGKVVWAHAVSGPVLLRKSAEDAARGATFAPFKLEGKPEKVSGVLIYKFVR